MRKSISKKQREKGREAILARFLLIGAVLLSVLFNVSLVYAQLPSANYQSIVYAQPQSANYQSFSFSDSSSNPQYFMPGSYSGYSQQYASVYWPALATPDKCESASDFLMFIRPGSCTPRVVRSDLLSEQNVPVFCKVDLIKLNPLIDLSNIKSVRFASKEFGQHVAGVNFHPNRAAIYSQKGLIDNPLINDAGYVVVVLKRILKEKDMPSSVKVNLTGVLVYDSSGLFGPGKAYYYLNASGDEEWKTGDNYKENSIFKGRGFLRAESIEPERARISIYRDRDERLVTFELGKGETSGVYYLPGFYCRAALQVTLRDIEAGVERVKLEVDGDEFWLVEGETFLDGKCRVLDINIHNKTRNVSVRCGMKTEVLSYVAGEQRKPNLQAEEGQEKTQEEKETEEIAKLSKDIRENFIAAKKYAEDIANFYGDAGKGNEIFSAKSLYQLGILAEKLKMNETAKNIFSKVIKDYPETIYASSAGQKAGKETAPSTSFNEHTIRLIKIETPILEDASADFIVKKLRDGKSEEKKVMENGDIILGTFKLLKLYPEEVRIAYTYSAADGKNKESLKTEEFKLSYKDRTARYGDYEITLNNINLKLLAKVSVNARLPRDISETNFPVEIGIEKRAIKLSPSRMKETIENLNETIERWEGIVDNLGKAIKGMKAACFATSGILMIKNFFSNLQGGAVARQAIMPAWYDKCKQLFGDDRVAFENCLRENSDKIENDVEAYEQNLEQVNKRMIKLQDEHKNPKTGFVDRKKVAEELRKEFPSGLSYTPYALNEAGEIQKGEEKKIENKELEKASMTDLRDLKLNLGILNSEMSESVRLKAGMKIEEIHKRLKEKPDSAQR